MSNGHITESNSSFGPWQLGYLYLGAGSEVFGKWFPTQPPRRGLKMHVSSHPGSAETVAQLVLPRLREMNVHHKVAKNLAVYQSLMEGEQRGKFITIYMTGAAQGDEVLNAIDPPLADLRRHRLIVPGPVVYTRESQHREAEVRFGTSGFIFARFYDEGSSD